MCVCVCVRVRVCVPCAGLCALHLAVLANSLHAVRSLLEVGASAEVQELSSGRTPLHLAVEQQNISLSGCLLLEVCVCVSVSVCVCVSV